MLTDRRTPDATDEQSRSAWDEPRFWAGTFGVFSTTLVLSLGVLTLVLSVALGYRPVAVISGSMEPAISVGDLVLYQPNDLDGIAQGAIVVFDDPVNEGGTIIHRVVDIDPDTGSLQTQGDANGDPDSVLVTEDDIRGVGRILIPYAGLPAALIQTGQHAAAFALIGFVVLATWAARWGWFTRYDPWAKDGTDGPLRDRVQRIVETHRSP